MSKIYIGTCGFTEPALNGTFYPSGLDPKERISWYAKHFNAVEIDSSFYAMPSERNSLLFAERTPPDFVFHFKAFGLMTGHPVDVKRLGRALSAFLPRDFKAERITDPPREMLEMAFSMFRSALRPLQRAGKIGAVLFQFPPWFKKSEANEGRIALCRELMPDYRIAVEFRHRSWTSDEALASTLQLLERHDMSYVSVDEPQISSSVQPIAEVTSSMAYVRFHGRNEKSWAKRGASIAERFNYFYSAEELFEWIPKVRRLEDRSDEVHLMFNNCFNGYAVRNAREMAELIGALEDKRPFSWPLKLDIE